MQDLLPTAAQIARFDVPGPRYTSYPTVPHWSAEIGTTEQEAALARASERTGPLSLYVHIPFCISRCHFCACNVTIIRKQETAERYLDQVALELERVAGLLGERRTVSQLHWGGGTPTFLEPANLSRLHGLITDHFTLSPDAEVSLEIHPGVTSEEQIAVLLELGFDRLSMGVQDFDPGVQERINRHQTVAQTARMLALARAGGMTGINVDLIYGLPGQSQAGFGATLDEVLAMHPDRLAVYSFAYLPQRVPGQRVFDPEELPDAAAKIELFLLARRTLLEAGYRAIGFDHFCTPDDELAQALDAGTLRRNFMGFSTRQGLDLIGIGASAITTLQDAFFQNHKGVKEYSAAITATGLATERGLGLSADDRIRQALIERFLCNFTISHEILARYVPDLDPADFPDLAAGMAPSIADGLVEEQDGTYVATALGRLFARNVAMHFDAYLTRSPDQVTYSRTI